MGAVYDRLEISVNGEVKPFLKISPTCTDQDAYLDTLLNAAKEAADVYLLNPFLDDDLVTELPIPDQVKIGCLQWMRAVLNESPGNVVTEKAGDISRTYSQTVDFALQRIRRVYWTPYRLIPGT